MSDLSSDPLPPCPPEVEAELDRRIAEAKTGDVLTVDEMRALMSKLKATVMPRLLAKFPHGLRDELAEVRMDNRHDHLNELLDENKE